MKVMQVSQKSFTSSSYVSGLDYNFLYQKDTSNKKDRETNLRRYSLATAAIAVSAVMIALYNLGSRKKFHSNIVEIPDLTKGLNKIKNHEDTIEIIKNKFIYPIKAADLGDDKIAKSKDYKTGLIITGDDKMELRKIGDALREHFSKLDIDTVFVKQSVKKKKDGSESSRRMKKNELVKRFITEVEKAKEKYKNTGKYTVISLGKFEDLTSLRITKSTQSKIDDLITKITHEESPGVIWCAWTTESTSLPLFLSDLPVLITKI